MRHGTRVGIDPGDARIGVARSDPSGFLATPVETVRRGKGDLARLRRIVADLEEETTVLEVVVGLPRSLGGGEGPAAVKVACASASSAITSVCGTTAFGKPLSTKSAYPRLANVRMSSPSGVAAARSASA